MIFEINGLGKVICYLALTWNIKAKYYHQRIRSG